MTQTDNQSVSSKSIPSDQYCRSAWLAICESQAVVEFDSSGTITWANASFINLVGYKSNDLIGKHHRVLCESSYARSDAYALFWQKLRAGHFDRGVYPRRRGDGQAIWLQATYNPLLIGKNVHRILKVATDVTDKVMLQSALENREAVLAQTVLDLADIVKNISTLANQAKLLALNASIEAARSGDAGLGFGVIATEMKRLSQNTQDAIADAVKRFSHYEDTTNI